MKKLTFEQWYPTKKAREEADKVIDRMPMSETMAEHIRAWELTYVEAGGIVKGRE